MTVDWRVFAIAIGLWTISEILGVGWRYAEKTSHKALSVHLLGYDGAFTFAALIVLAYSIRPWWIGVILVLVGWTTTIRAVALHAKKLGIPEYLGPREEAEEKDA